MEESRTELIDLGMVCDRHLFLVAELAFHAYGDKGLTCFGMISPTAMMVLEDGAVYATSIDGTSIATERLLESIPELFEKLDSLKRSK